ncbi:MAG: hypothetical protein HC895_06015 [Leptolyngbyaceae cyanobacterium SM1_3_5]|nr:hypothetical protein [Leptolyngbyaceae cyanobacterium SM1_3_5]
MARGDQIYVLRPFAGLSGIYEHHGIDCGDGTVIHFRKTDTATIAHTSIAEFAMGRQIFVKHYPVSYISDIVIDRAESRLGEQNYNLLTNNCEHFATWCKTGRADCQQLADFGLGVGGVGGESAPPLITEAAETGDPIAAVQSFDQAVHNITYARNHLQPQYDQAIRDVNTWQRVARLALKQNREDLARAALERKVSFQKAADDFKMQLDQLDTMQRSLEQNRSVIDRKLTRSL